eukprot:jgi/Mesvir1/16617/Mv10151-RA.1
MEELTGLARRLRSNGGMHNARAATASMMQPAQSAPPPPVNVPPPAQMLPSVPSQEGSEMTALTPLAPAPVRTAVVKGGFTRHGTGQASVGGGRSGVIPAILGVGAAIGTIHFGAGIFPDVFKGADGKIDRSRLNVGGVMAGIIVFLVARYFYAK